MNIKDKNIYIYYIYIYNTVYVLESSVVAVDLGDALSFIWVSGENLKLRHVEIKSKSFKKFNSDITQKKDIKRQGLVERRQLVSALTPGLQHAILAACWFFQSNKHVKSKI